MKGNHLPERDPARANARFPMWMAFLLQLTGIATAEVPQFFLDARSNLSIGAGNTYPALPQQDTHMESWASIGQPDNPRLNVIARQRIPGRIELRSSSYWAGASGSTIVGQSKGRFAADIRFADKSDPESTGTVSVSLNLAIDGRATFACLEKNRPDKTHVDLALRVRLNGILQEGEFSLNSPSHTVTKSGLFASLSGTDEFSGETLKGKTLKEMITTDSFTVQVNQDVRLEVEFEVCSSAMGTDVCSQAHGLFENGFGLPFGQSVFSGVPDHIDVRSDDLFVRNNRWGPVVSIRRTQDELRVAWPALLNTNMILECAPLATFPYQWSTVETMASESGPSLEIAFPKTSEAKVFRLREKTE